MIQLQVGGLYSYNNLRGVHPDREGTQDLIGILEINEPFVLLESGGKHKWSETYKVLTTQGIVGWIHVLYPVDIRSFKKVARENPELNP